MKKKISRLIALFLCCILLIVTFSGCIESGKKSKEKALLVTEVKLDQHSILPDWNNGYYHDCYGTMKMLNDFNGKYPYLVNIFPIGESVLGRDIWCIRITNEKNTNQKSSCLIDGCIHGNEWEGGEACLYFAEYLLINFDRNESIKNLLNKSEVYIVPIVNPDGRQNDDRFNYNGIDLNRNFDVHFGRLKGWSIPLGKIFGFIKIKYIWFPLRKYFVTNCGRYPFSEPESKSMRKLMKELEHRDFSFSISLHTATHVFSRPSIVTIRPEYKISPRELEVFDYAKSWVENNTEYKQAKDKDKYGFGSSVSYCFKECHVPSFCLEILNSDYEPMFWHGKHDNLVHWMKTALPIFMYLLVNIDNFHQWETPDIQPSLPEGVPPEPLQ